jgi:hypothetical protein
MMPIKVRDIQREIENNLEYSLEVDPLGKYQLDDNQKLFVKLYIEYHNYDIIRTIMGLDIQDLFRYQYNFGINSEINRLERAIVVRRVSGKILKIDEIASYLTTMILGVDIPEKDKLTNEQKLKAISLLYKYHELSIDPEMTKKEVFDVVDFDEETRDLTTGEIKLLLSGSKKNKDKTRTPESSEIEVEGFKEGIDEVEDIPKLTRPQLIDLILSIAPDELDLKKSQLESLKKANLQSLLEDLLKFNKDKREEEIKTFVTKGNR